ncbi:transport system permease [Shigella sonnei]|nr:transport system permease [Shigella sonnei]
MTIVICKRWAQTKIELILCYSFKVLGFICDTHITIWCHIAGFSIHHCKGNDSNLLIVFYVQIMPDDFVMQLHRF